jgi:hypothetical protein
MTVETGMERLLKDVLALQDEDGRGAGLSEERAREVLSGRDTFTADEELLLAMSPLARSTCAEVREDLRLEEDAFLERCRGAGIETEITLPLAASDGEGVPEMFNADFSVQLRRRPFSEGWVVSLVLSDRFRRIVTPESWLILVDDRDVVWLRGQVNRYGEVHSYGLSCAEDLAQRVRKEGFKLRVRPG